MNLTRRGFLKRMGTILAVLGTGIKLASPSALDKGNAVIEHDGKTKIAERTRLDNGTVAYVVMPSEPQGGYIVPAKYHDAIMSGEPLELTTTYAPRWGMDNFGITTDVIKAEIEKLAK